MIRYAYDLYPRTDPVNGVRILRFSQLQEAEYRGEANGTGAGRIVLRGTSTDAASIDPLGLQYIRVVRIDEDTVDAGTLSGFDEAVVGGFFLEFGEFLALSENSSKRLTFGGAGAMSYLARAEMAHQSYLTSPFIGQDPFDDLWRLWNAGTGNELGAILWRIVTELQEAGRPQDPIPGLTLGFTYLVDSNGANWSRSSGDFTANVTDNVLTGPIKRLMEMGLYVSLDPDTFELNAYEPGTHARDRTGVAWGANVVRFQSPSAGTVASGNIKSDATRGLSAAVRRSDIQVGANDVYEWVNDPAANVVWEGHHRVENEDGTALTAIGTEQLSVLDDAGDTVRLRMKLANDPANGYYLPFESAGVMLDDEVTLHSGSGQWDWNEATYGVAAIAIKLRPGGDWDAWVDLGSTYSSIESRAFQARPVGPHNHPSNPELCRLPSPATNLTVVMFDSTLPGKNGLTPDWTAPDADDVGEGFNRLNIGDFGSENPGPELHSGGGAMVLLNAANIKGGSPSWSGDANRNFPGGTIATKRIGWGLLETYSDLVHLMNAADGSIGETGWQVHITGRVKHPHSTSWGFHGHTDCILEFWSNTNGAVKSQVDATLFADLCATNSGAGHENVIDIDQTFELEADTQSFNLLVAEDGADPDKDYCLWESLRVEVIRPGSAAVAGDAHADLVGTGKRASRCGHAHHVLRTAAPTVNDDEDDGYPVTTAWTDTTAGKSWVLTDATAGAAVWLLVAVTAHADLTGVSADQHHAQDHDLDSHTDVDTTSAPPTDGQVLTWNDYLQQWEADDPTAGSGDVATDAIWDAAGDLAVGTGADTAARLARGAALQHLRVNSGATALEWADPPSGGAGGGVTILSPSSDTYIDSQGTTTNHDTDTNVFTGNQWSTASFTRFALMTFDISSLAGKDIATAVLSLMRTDTTGAANNNILLQVRKVLRAYVPDEVTWNVYSTGNAWTTGGAQGAGDTATERYGHAPMTSNAANQELQVDIARLLQAALDAAETTLRIIIGWNQNTAASNPCQFASLEHATTAYRPKLRVAHS